tara:strand:+ start:1201 stop:1839 length:639 start_codon:yes stop_codon:yes gene_type:complete
MIDTSKIYTSNNCGKFKINNYHSCNNIIIEFIATKYTVKTNSDKVITGKIKDPLHPYRYDIGFVGIGKHTPSLKGKTSKAYRAWSNMLTRCYRGSYAEKNPTYKDCTVCDEWHDFQNFASWFNGNYTEGLHLDKDIKTEGNKVYSPLTCLFVSPADNAIKANAKVASLLSPDGIVVEFYNISEFCRVNGLDKSSVGKVLSGKRVSCKGWFKV